MASRAPGWIHMKFDFFPILNQLKNSLKSSRLDSYEIWSFLILETIKEWPQQLQAGFVWNVSIFQLRINQRTGSRAPGWIHMKFDYLSIQNQLKNSLKSSRLDSYEIWSLCYFIAIFRQWFYCNLCQVIAVERRKSWCQIECFKWSTGGGVMPYRCVFSMHDLAMYTYI